MTHQIIRYGYWISMILLALVWAFLALFAVPCVLLRYCMNRVTERYHRYEGKRFLEQHRMREEHAGS